MGELQYSVYKGKDGTLFITSPNKIVVQTNTQEFYLLAEEWNNEDKLDMISWFIQTGKIHDLGSLRRRIKGIFYLEKTYKRRDILEQI